MSLSRRRVGRALSPREREVLQLIWEGLQTKEIAARLDLAPHWIKNIRFAIGLKFGVHTMMAMVRAGLARGILKLPEEVRDGGPEHGDDSRPSGGLGMPVLRRG